MIKIFFDDRIFALSDDESECFNVMNGIGARMAETSEIADLFDLFERSPQIPEFRVFCKRIDETLHELIACNTFVRAAGGLVYDRSGRLLLIRRLGFWDLPKGKAEDDESERETAIREVEEECGLHCLESGEKLTNTYHVYRLGSERVLKETSWYAMRHVGDEIPTPQIDEDIEQAKWVEPENLHEYTEMYASIKDVLRTAGLSNG